MRSLARVHASLLATSSSAVVQRSAHCRSWSHQMVGAWLAAKPWHKHVVEQLEIDGPKLQAKIAAGTLVGFFGTAVSIVCPHASRSSGWVAAANVCECNFVHRLGPTCSTAATD